MISWEANNNDGGLRAIYIPLPPYQAFKLAFPNQTLADALNKNPGKVTLASAHKTDKVRNCRCTFVLARKGHQRIVARGKISTFCLQ
jgi:hypothetical protein